MVEDTVSALDMLADYNLQVTQGEEQLHGRCCVDRFGVVVAACCCCCSLGSACACLLRGVRRART